MGALITAEKIEGLSTKKLQKLKPKHVNELQPEVKAIYDRRMEAQQISLE